MNVMSMVVVVVFLFFINKCSIRYMHRVGILRVQCNFSKKDYLFGLLFAFCALRPHVIRMIRVKRERGMFNSILVFHVPPFLLSTYYCFIGSSLIS